MLEREWIVDPLNGPDNRIAYDHLLADLSRRFAEHGKTNEDYGLAEPASTQTEIERYDRRFASVRANISDKPVRQAGRLRGVLFSDKTV